MADVRSMLRAERAARRITHPHASYTSDGKLLCNLCETLVKNEAHWQSHLHSTQHTLRSQRIQDAKEARGSKLNGGSKKRKAETLDDEAPRIADKKRPRASSDGDDEEISGKRQQMEDTKEHAMTTRSADDEATKMMPPPPEPQAADTNTAREEEELAAFERDLAALEAESNAQAASALDSEATISAAPMTAEQLATQAREEASTQRGKRDQEIEDEKEDAARVFEEELDEMEGLEERVRKLREKREALRRASEGVESSRPVVLAAFDDTLKPVKENRDEGNDDEDDDDYDEEDDWMFGGR